MIALLYDLLHMLPLCLIGVVQGVDYYEKAPEKCIFWCFAIVVAVLISLFFHSKNKLKYLFIGLFFMAMVSSVLVQKPTERYEFALNNFWLVELVCWGIACEIIGNLTSRNKWIRRGMGISFIGAAVISVAWNIAVKKSVVAIAFFLLMVYLINEIQQAWKKAGDIEPRRHLVFLTPFLVLISLLVFWAPASDRPYDWKLAVTVWEKTVEMAKTLTKYLPLSGVDDFAQVGFGENAGMCGKIEHDTKNLMEVTINSNVGKVFYLAGKTFTTYKNNEWICEDTKRQQGKILEMLETECAVRAYDGDHYRDYIRASEIKFKYQIFNTKYLFVPSKSFIYGEHLDQVRYVEYQDALRSSGRIGYGTSYKVKYDRCNTEKEKFGEFMNNRHYITEELWEQSLKCAMNGYTKGTTYQDYLRHRQDIYQDYTEEIVISPELRQVLDEVYDGAESDWDKLRKIEEWLNTFDYTETPGPLPKSIANASEYLDYFLLDSKKGYCVHFATAFTLLAREEGFPARFVQGCYVKIEKDKMMVTSDMVHAWPEVYLENFGWLAFEPTPRYKVDNSWGVSDDYVSQEQVQQNNYAMQEKEDDMKEEGVMEPEKEEYPVKLIVGVIGTCCLFVTACLIGYSIFIKKKMKKISKVNLKKVYCRCNLCILHYLGHKMKKNETLAEYKKRIAQEDIEAEALAFIDMFEQILYACGEEKEDAFLVILSSQRRLLGMLKEKKKIRMFIYKIRLSVRFASYIVELV